MINCRLGSPQRPRSITGAFFLSEDPSDPRNSLNLPPSGSRSHPHGSFLLPGLTARGERATLPSGIRFLTRRLGLSPRVARLFLPASAEGKRARATKLCCCSPRWLAPDTTLARLLLALRWLPLKNLSLSAAVSQALRTNTAAGRAFFVSNLLAQPPRVA